MGWFDKLFRRKEITLPPEGQARGLSGKWVKQGGGWKIHLAVLLKNQKGVYDWLFQNCEYGWKYKAGGEEGQEFTIYVGSFDDTTKFAIKLEEHIGDLLSTHINQTRHRDLIISRRVAARFDPTTSLKGMKGFVDTQGEIHLGGRELLFNEKGYGPSGIPITVQDQMVMVLRKKEFSEKEANKYSYKFIKEKGGEYFTGRNEAVKKFLKF